MNPEEQPLEPTSGDPQRSERFRPRDTQPLAGLPDQPPAGGFRRLASRRALLALGIASISLILLAALAGLYLLAPKQPPAPEVTPPSSLSELATEYPELGTILQDNSLDSVYKDFLLVYEQEGPEAALELARTRGLLNANDELRLTLELDTNELEPAYLGTGSQWHEGHRSP